MTDWLEIVKTAAGPLAGVFSGLAGSMLGLKTRLEKVESKLKAVDTRISRHGSAIEGHTTLFSSIDDEFEKLHAELTRYREKYQEFADSMRKSSMDFAKDDELANFMSEQQERWQTIQRTLGHIEGFLGLNQQPQPPRPVLRQSSPRLPPPLPQDSQPPRRKS